jgi:hypothetical protein
MPLTSAVQRVEAIVQRCGERSNGVRTGGPVEGVDWGCGGRRPMLWFRTRCGTARNGSVNGGVEISNYCRLAQLISQGIVPANVAASPAPSGLASGIGSG